MSQPNELTRCSDALALAVAALLPAKHDPALIAAFRVALSDLLAATLGGATTMVAGAVVALDAKVEKLSAARIRQLHDIQVDLHTIATRLHALEDEFLDSGTVGQIGISVAALALEVERLKDRQVGDGASA